MMLSRAKDPGLGRSGRVTPRLEALEDRCCPSSVTFSNHILTLTGDSSDSTMVVSDDGHGGVKVTLNGHATSVSGVQQILINSKAGDDTIRYALTNPLTTSEQLKVNLGGGQDLVKLDYSKGVSAGSLKININGGGGYSAVTAEFGKITNTDLDLSAQLGSSWEQFTAQFKGDLTGKAMVDVNVHGGDGIGNVDVRANGAIAATAQLNVTENLGAQSNTSHVDYKGKLSGKLSVRVQGGSAWNWLESHFDLTPGSTGSLSAHERGGPSADLLLLKIQDGGSRLKSLDAQINGGGGRDTMVHTPNVVVLKPGK